ncbi:MAG: type II toxin-antitoxin system VapC family toxin [Caulobacterales bacterium]|nr:type II toxin-antitoxin system VapC family toxin [Caulobacterales bacterium]
MADKEISKNAEDALSNAYAKKQPILICPVTGWEAGMLHSKGRLPLVNGPLDWYNALIKSIGAIETKLEAEEMVKSSFLGGTPPNDPFDRLIIATAKKYDVTIITRDKKILAYAAAGNCKALEC